jgi:hypothetical protein
VFKELLFIFGSRIEEIRFDELFIFGSRIEEISFLEFWISVLMFLVIM